jgi:hypothetical protein
VPRIVLRGSEADILHREDRVASLHSGDIGATVVTQMPRRPEIVRRFRRRCPSWRDTQRRCVFSDRAKVGLPSMAMDQTIAILARCFRCRCNLPSSRRWSMAEQNAGATISTDSWASARPKTTPFRPRHKALRRASLLSQLAATTPEPGSTARLNAGGTINTVSSATTPRPRASFRFQSLRH